MAEHILTRLGDMDDLDRLATFFKMAGVVTALLATLPVVYLALAAGMLVLPVLVDGSSPMEGAPFACCSGVGGTIAIVVGWFFAICLFMTSRNLKRRKNWAFCIVFSCIVCLEFPLGTLLGIYSLTKLNEDGIKQLFT